MDTLSLSDGAVFSSGFSSPFLIWLAVVCGIGVSAELFGVCSVFPQAALACGYVKDALHLERYSQPHPSSRCQNEAFNTRYKSYFYSPCFLIQFRFAEPRFTALSEPFKVTSHDSLLRKDLLFVVISEL